jgi:hypothetical protein
MNDIVVEGQSVKYTIPSIHPSFMCKREKLGKKFVHVAKTLKHFKSIYGLVPKMNVFMNEKINYYALKKKQLKKMIKLLDESCSNLENACDAEGCTVRRRTNKIVDLDGKKYHSFSCRDANSNNFNPHEKIVL